MYKGGMSVAYELQTIPGTKIRRSAKFVCDPTVPLIFSSPFTVVYDPR
jgi:hypothetical protein